ncbi:mycofactocin biosynthesis glycosyltransferase MftF [Pseudonocardia parietis]|uniref:Mycofactocin system glycosyltransferase n=1 Tax=Pseudonocardia parietis TaxID=570936 RepID=A0ABS4VP66_9PSEU|nr:mycofactocin biosynthesis glycosyltransferase MftF [Pseudonocardia parietis]MBP2365543.1 mycofactocin system glycosyltransferase [Pseudonocardia parietis]
MTAADTRPDHPNRPDGADRAAHGASGPDGPAGSGGPADRRLPDGFAALLDRRTRWIDGGAALLGGAPPRLVHLSAKARALLPPPGRPLVVEGPVHRALARTLLDAGLAHPVVSSAGARPNPAVSGAATGAGPVGVGPAAAGPVAGRPAAVGPDEVTVVVPVKDRPLDRLLAALGPVGAVGPLDPAHPADPANPADLVGPLNPAGRNRPQLGGLVVVDDGSEQPDPLRRSVEAVGGTVLRHEHPQGPAAARNAGLAAARTPYVVFLDSDVVPEPGWLEPLLGHLADPAVGLVAPRIVALDPERGAGLRGTIGRYEALRSSLDLGPDPALIVPRSRVAYVPSAAMLVRVSAVTGVGGAFDPGMHVAEDVDLVLRLHAAGWAMRFEPLARVAHDHRTRPWEWLRRKAFYGTGAAPLAQRHPGAVPPVVLSPWTAAVCLLLLAQRRGATAVAAGVTVVATERLSRKLSRLDSPRRTAAGLIALGLSGALWQTASALTRHFWPVAAVACVVSSRARRAVVVAALAEGVADWWSHRDRDPRVRVPVAVHLTAHRLDDLAYGAGLWWGAWRNRTSAPLRPAGPGSRR